MKRLRRTYKFITFALLGIVLLGSPVIILCQPKIFGQLSLTRENDRYDYSAKINNVRSTDGQVVTSPSKIETPVGTKGLINLGETGFIAVASDSKVNLAFDETKITGFLLKGELSITVPPNVALNIQTNDAVVSVPGKSRENVVTVDFINGRTRLRTLSGAASLNGTTVAARQFFISGGTGVGTIISEQNSTIFSKLILPAAIVFQAMLGVIDKDNSNFGAEQVNVGPMK